MDEKKHLPKHVPDMTDSDQAKSLRRSWRSSGAVTKLTAAFAGIAALATAIYAIASVWQLAEFRKSLDLSRDYFQKDQRPYIFANRIGPVQLTGTNQPASSFSYKNYGKSPALHVRHAGDIFFGNNALGQADEWFKNLGDGFPPQGRVKG